MSARQQEAEAFMIGRRFGRLTVVARGHDQWGGAGWACRCDCGAERVWRRALLSTGNTKSCGCLRRDRNLERNARNALPDGEASFRGLLNHYRRNARKRGHVFDLTEGEFRRLTKESCAYCGAPPSRRYLDNPKANGAYICNGVDRFDNGAGYSVENSVTCCADCNMAKGAMPSGAWLALLQRVAAHWRGRDPRIQARAAEISVREIAA